VKARVLFFALVTLVAAADTAAGDEPRAARLAVDFAAEPPSPGWYASALEQLVARELSRFAGVELTEKLDAHRCPDRDSRCLVAIYRALGVQVIVLGRVRQRTLDYEVFETWSGTRASRGALAISGVTSASLQRHLGELVRPIVQHGGLLDERPGTESAAQAVPAKGSTSAPSAAQPVRARGRAMLLPCFLLAAMAFLALPIGLTHLLVRRRELHKRAYPASWTWSAAVLAVLGTLALVTSIVDARALWLGPAPTPRALSLSFPALAGMLWGVLVLLNASWVLAPIQGLGQIRHDALWPLLRSYLALAILRASALFFYAPFVLLTLRACAELEVPERATLALVLPAACLLVYFWLLTVVDNLSLFLDVHLVIGLSTTRNPWHGTLKRYFSGYVRRGAIELDPGLLERTLFLPSLLPDVISYGGGFARPRILVGEAARECALGGLPEETEFPDRTVNPEELPFGILFGGEEDDSELGRQRQASAERLRRRLTLAPMRPRRPAPRLLGESATLLGWVLPQPGDQGIPLIANDSDDYDVVKRLLTQHYAGFERNSDDDEVDDTDPTQKDFLFGALLREMGTLARRDTFFATIWYSLALAWPRTSWAYRLLIRPPLALYERFLSGPAARVADAYTALNQGLHPLLQYLCFLRGVDEARLTARASVPSLIETSRDLLERMAQEPLRENEHGLLAAHPLNRLRWLSQFFHAKLASRMGSAARVLGGMAVAVILVVWAASAVRNAVDYHSVYLERVRPAATQSTQGAARDGRTGTQ
jgi:hypothetical protein